MGWGSGSDFHAALTPHNFFLSHTPPQTQAPKVPAPLPGCSPHSCNRSLPPPRTPRTFSSSRLDSCPLPKGQSLGHLCLFLWGTPTLPRRAPNPSRPWDPNHPHPPPSSLWLWLLSPQILLYAGDFSHLAVRSQLRPPVPGIWLPLNLPRTLKFHQTPIFLPKQTFWLVTLGGAHHGIRILQISPPSPTPCL